MESVLSIAKIALLITAGLAVLGLVLLSMYRNNRLFFWSLVAAAGLHFLFFGISFAAGKLIKEVPEEVRIKIASFRPEPPKPKQIEKPKQKPLENFNIPWGSTTGKRNAKIPPKGTNKFGQKAGKAGDKSKSKPAPGRPMVSGLDEHGTVPIDEKDEGLFSGTFEGVIDTADIRTIASNGDGGNGGDGAGHPDGEGDGEIPAGFPNGKIGGRMYFMRLKHGSGAWNAHNEGTRRLLSFLNQYFPCESEGRAMTSGELRDKYMRRNTQPSFLYIYVDDSFSLTGTDSTVLREYVNKGGFLFVDSRYDPDIKARVERELGKMLGGLRLAPLSNSHPINRFLFTLSSPGVGLNFVEQKNYGITKGGRLVVFYTPGNFSECYELHAANEHEYFTAQYQMGANVMVYGMLKGDASSVNTRKGADARVTTQTMEKLGFLDSPKGPEKKDPEESVKIKRDPPVIPDSGEAPPPPEDPDEIKLLD